MTSIESIDPDEPMFEIYANDRHVATMFDPRFEGMFWCSYRLEAVDGCGDQIIHNAQTWERVAFEVRDMHGAPLSRPTFSGGFADFCDRKTNRLTFRSLWSPTPSLASRLFAACAAMLGYNRQQERSHRTKA
ncbi:MAG: hypothetical protein RIC55_25580 [Pirellulaceae bacterium]